MTKSRGLAFTFMLACALASGACTKAEPDIPTFGPMDKVQLRKGWNVGRSVAVSPQKQFLDPNLLKNLESTIARQNSWDMVTSQLK